MLIFDNFCWHHKLEIDKTHVWDTAGVAMWKHNTLFGRSKKIQIDNVLTEIDIHTSWRFNLAYLWYYCQIFGCGFIYNAEIKSETEPAPYHSKTKLVYFNKIIKEPLNFCQKFRYGQTINLFWTFPLKFFLSKLKQRIANLKIWQNNCKLVRARKFTENRIPAELSSKHGSRTDHRTANRKDIL